MSEENTNKKYATLLRSQIELIKMFPRETQLDLLWMLIDYELDGTEPILEADEDGPSKLQIFWNMSRPLADSRSQKAANGRKGGIQKAKNSKAVAKSSKKVATSSKRLAKSSKGVADSSNALADKEKDMEMDKEMEYPSPKGEEKTEHSHTPLGGGARSEDEEYYPEFEGIGDYDELPVDENGDWIWPEDD